MRERAKSDLNFRQRFIEYLSKIVEECIPDGFTSDEYLDSPERPGSRVFQPFVDPNDRHFAKYLGQTEPPVTTTATFLSAPPFTPSRKARFLAQFEGSPILNSPRRSPRKFKVSTPKLTVTQIKKKSPKKEKKKARWNEAPPQEFQLPQLNLTPLPSPAAPPAPLTASFSEAETKDVFTSVIDNSRPIHPLPLRKPKTAKRSPLKEVAPHPQSHTPIRHQSLSAFNKGTFSQSASSGSDISARYTRKKIVTSIPHFPAKVSSKKVRTLATELSVEPKNDVVNIVWKGLVPETLNQSSSHQRLPAPPFESTNLLDSPPSFPFSESPDLQSFPFLPILPQLPPMPFFEPLESISAKPVHASKVRHPGAYVTTGEETRNGLGPLARKHAACYEWNHYLDCNAGKDGKCHKRHVWEICASAEHRAAQHWHHDA